MAMRIASVLALGILLFAQGARAFFDPPHLTPEVPTTGQVVSVGIRGGICDDIVEMSGYPQITRNGNAIRILFFGVHRTSSEECIYPTGTLTQPIGVFPAGSYTLQVDMLYSNWPFGYDVMAIGTVPFTVAALPAAARPVPANAPFALTLLVLLVAGIAAWALRARSQGC